MKKTYMISVIAITGLLLFSVFAQAGLVDWIGNIFNPSKPKDIIVTIDEELKATAELATDKPMDEKVILENEYIAQIEQAIQKEYLLQLTDLCRVTAYKLVGNKTISYKVPIDKKLCIEKKKLVIDFIKGLD